jgi:sulfate adenylyltransferase subunit 2
MNWGLHGKRLSPQPKDPVMRHLRDLEAQSINILREAYDHLDLTMFWSKEMESTVLLWLVRKAFNGRMPIPLIQIDTEYDIPELTEYQDRLFREWRLNRVQTNVVDTVWKDSLRRQGTHCDIKEIEMLEEVMTRHCWTAVLLDTLADTEGTETNKHHFSLCQTLSGWDLHTKPPQAWTPYRMSIPDGSYIRVHPLLNWTKSDVWEYLEQEQIPLPESYLSHSMSYVA